jgi:hypothetical protein
VNDLVQWLRRELDEDERVAQFALSLESDEFEYEYRWSRYSRHKVSGGSGTMSLAGAPTPRDMLAGVNAKRRILELHHRIDCEHDRSFSTSGDCAECGSEYPCETVRLSALPLAERDGYREEWAP